LLAAKFHSLLGEENPVTANPPRSEKTIHCSFRLINFLFSDELGTAVNTSDDVNRLALDSGAVGCRGKPPVLEAGRREVQWGVPQ
jgi:hypothetical protein